MGPFKFLKMNFILKWLRWATQILRRFFYLVKEACQWLSRVAYPRAKRLWAVLRVVLFSLMCLYVDAEGIGPLQFLFQLLEMTL